MMHMHTHMHMHMHARVHMCRFEMHMHVQVRARGDDPRRDDPICIYITQRCIYMCRFELGATIPAETIVRVPYEGREELGGKQQQGTQVAK